MANNRLSSSHPLVEMLYKVRNDRRTGRIVIFARKHGRTIALTIVVADGEIMRIRFPGMEEWAAIKCFTSTGITSIQFSPANGRMIQRTPDTPTIVQLLKHFGGGNGTEAVRYIRPEVSTSAPGTQTIQLNDSQKRRNSDDLQVVSQIQSMFLELFGDTGENRVKAIAAKHPPQQDPKMFLDTCERLVSTMFGSMVADTLFANVSKQLGANHAIVPQTSTTVRSRRPRILDSSSQAESGDLPSGPSRLLASNSAPVLQVNKAE